ncbi:hypothetical protein FQR65_LT20937 [Abscondita terminalis]|nr:hypothetical protein FQR65_LT20937 [Abscondita terminalis]
MLTVFAQRRAAVSVKTSKEILIERGAANFHLERPCNVSGGGREAVAIQPTPKVDGAKTSTRNLNSPRATRGLRLEDQRRGEGQLDGPRGPWLTLNFGRPAPTTWTRASTSMKRVLGGASPCGDRRGRQGGARHRGNRSRPTAIPGRRRGPGADHLPRAVADALLSLERDKVESTALLSKGGDWLRVERLSPTQYRARVPVKEHFSPNLTFSAAVHKGGEYSFQKRRHQSGHATDRVAIATDKAHYQPGETVTWTCLPCSPASRIPAHSDSQRGDEMVYALQPEVAPSIDQFFYHPRRNNVRTSASLSFISYDVALARQPKRPAKSNARARGQGLAAAPGRPSACPDSLTRWRITPAPSPILLPGRTRSNQFVRFRKGLLPGSGAVRRAFRVGERPDLGLFAFSQAEQGNSGRLMILQQQSSPVKQKDANGN